MGEKEVQEISLTFFTTSGYSRVLKATEFTPHRTAKELQLFESTKP